MGVSLKPSEFQTGGLLNKANATVKRARFTVWDYDGKGKETLALSLTLVDDDGKEEIQYYSAGDPTRFTPIKEGKEVDALGSAKTLSGSSNFAFFLSRTVEAGFSEDTLGSGDITVLEGLYAFWERVPAPDRGGDFGTKKEGGRPPTILVPTKILESKKGGKGATSSAAASSSDSYDDAVAYVMEFLSEKGDSTKKTINSQAFPRIGAKPNRNATVQALTKGDVYERMEAEGLITVNDDGVVSVA